MNIPKPDKTLLPSSGRLAGIDFGTVRIGIAVCDREQIISSPLETYVCRSPHQDADYFKQLARRESLCGFVLGLPVHMSGDESQKSQEVRRFGAWLNEQTGLPVDWMDERYTTVLAREFLSQSGLSGKARKAKLDKIAAQIILSAYLQCRTHHRKIEAIE